MDYALKSLKGSSLNGLKQLKRDTIFEYVMNLGHFCVGSRDANLEIDAVMPHMEPGVTFKQYYKNKHKITLNDSDEMLGVKPYSRKALFCHRNATKINIPLTEPWP